MREDLLTGEEIAQIKGQFAEDYYIGQLSDEETIFSDESRLLQAQHNKSYPAGYWDGARDVVKCLETVADYEDVCRFLGLEYEHQL